MPITLGNYTFDPVHTVFHESYEELGGRDARTIRLEGLLSDTTIAGLEAQLDTLLAAASPDASVTALSLRTGRQLWVRRVAFNREFQRESGTATFSLTLEAPDGWEESQDYRNASWTVTSTGQSHLLSVGGNRWTWMKTSITALDTVIEPAISDGYRTITYPGVLSTAEVLIFDGEAQRVLLNDRDITPQCIGLFPRLLPGVTAIVYTDSEESSHNASLSAKWRERWW